VDGSKSILGQKLASKCPSVVLRCCSLLRAGKMEMTNEREEADFLLVLPSQYLQNQWIETTLR
jgi:hypothetical protein